MQPEEPEPIDVSELEGLYAGGQELHDFTGISEVTVGERLSAEDAPPAKALMRRGRVWHMDDAVIYLMGTPEQIAETKWKPAPNVADLGEIAALLRRLGKQNMSATAVMNRLNHRNAPEGIGLASGRVWPDGGLPAAEWILSPKPSKPQPPQHHGHHRQPARTGTR